MVEERQCGAQVAKVLPPGEMQQVRQLVKDDPRLEETVKKDVAQDKSTTYRKRRSW